MTAGNAVERDSITSKVFERVGRFGGGGRTFLKKGFSRPLQVL